jgi:PPOX class probable F420-dependent enzyme
MQIMSDSEWRAFVSAGTRTGKIATVRRDGRPHVAPIWFLLEGDDIVFNTGARTVKGRSVSVPGARAALCVDDERPPFSFVVLEGPVSLSEDPDDLLDTATRIAARYMGEEKAEEFGRRNGVPGELVVRIHVDKVIAHRDLTE